MAEVAAAAAVAQLFVGIQASRQADKNQRALARQKQEQLKVQQTIIDQDVVYEAEAERTRQALISRQGNLAEGDMRVSGAARGVLVDVGSEADMTKDLAAEVAMKKLLSDDDHKQRLRMFEIARNDIDMDIAAVRFESAAASQAAKTEQFSSVLTSASTNFARFDYNATPGSGLTFR